MWDDSADGDGIMETGEPKLAERRVLLWSQYDNLYIKQTTTDANGNYSFSVLRSENYYKVAYVIESGKTYTRVRSEEAQNINNDTDSQQSTIIFTPSFLLTPPPPAAPLQTQTTEKNAGTKPVDTRPKIAIEQTADAIPGYAGSLLNPVTFSLDKKSDKTNGGWIIQRIQFVVTADNGTEKVVDHYWEAWRVPPDSDVPDKTYEFTLGDIAKDELLKPILKASKLEIPDGNLKTKAHDLYFILSNDVLRKGTISVKTNVRFLDGMPEKEMDWIPGAVPRSVKLHSLEYTTANALIVDKLFEKYKAKNPQKTRELVAVWNIDSATTQGKTIVKKNTIKDW